MFIRYKSLPPGAQQTSKTLSPWVRSIASETSIDPKSIENNFASLKGKKLLIYLFPFITQILFNIYSHSGKIIEI